MLGGWGSFFVILVLEVRDRNLSWLMKLVMLIRFGIDR